MWKGSVTLLLFPSDTHFDFMESTPEVIKRRKQSLCLNSSTRTKISHSFNVIHIIGCDLFLLRLYFILFHFWIWEIPFDFLFVFIFKKVNCVKINNSDTNYLFKSNINDSLFTHFYFKLYIYFLIGKGSREKKFLVF